MKIATIVASMAATAAAAVAPFSPHHHHRRFQSRPRTGFSRRSSMRQAPC
jgi:hypothetical protein